MSAAAHAPSVFIDDWKNKSGQVHSVKEGQLAEGRGEGAGRHGTGVGLGSDGSGRGRSRSTHTPCPPIGGRLDSAVGDLGSSFVANNYFNPWPMRAVLLSKIRQPLAKSCSITFFVAMLVFIFCMRCCIGLDALSVDVF